MRQNRWRAKREDCGKKGEQEISKNTLSETTQDPTPGERRPWGGTENVLSFIRPSFKEGGGSNDEQRRMMMMMRRSINLELIHLFLQVYFSLGGGLSVHNTYQIINSNVRTYTSIYEEEKCPEAK